MRRLLLTAVLAAVLAGCGGDDGGNDQGNQAPASAPQGDHALAVADTDLGKVLVDGRGRTLYLLTADSRNKSSCSGACAKQWPPAMLGGNSTSGPGIDRQKFGSISAPGGERQLTYAGHPLYEFAGDKAAGDTNGQGIQSFGGEWYAVAPSGEPVEDEPESGDDSGGGGGGGY